MAVVHKFPSLIASVMHCPTQSTQKPHANTCVGCFFSDLAMDRPTPNQSKLPIIHMWNINHKYCMPYDLTNILDIGHVGHVVRQSSGCLEECSINLHCLTCQSQPHCGWCSISSSTSGLGVCVEGTRTDSSQCYVEMVKSSLKVDVSDIQWNYLSCPSENECANGHHTCDTRVQQCVDQLIGEFRFSVFLKCFS